MDFSKLYLMIDDRKKRLEEIVSIEDKNLVFFENFIDNNSFSINGLLNVDYTELISVYLYGLSKKMDVDEIYELVLKCGFVKDFDYDYDSMSELFKLLSILNNTDELNDVPLEKIARYVKRNLFKNIDFYSVKQLYDIYGSELVEIIAIVSVIDDIKLEYDYNSKKIDFLDELFEISNNKKDKKKEKVLTSVVKDNYNVKRIFDKLSTVINRCYSNLKSEDKKKKKEARKSIMNYTMLVSNLKKYNREQFLNKNIINDMISMVENEDILREFLIQINNLQREYFEGLEKEYLKFDSSASIQVMFNNYNVDFNKLSISLKNKLLMEEKDELENFLKLIKDFGITDFDMICYLLEKSNSMILKDFINFMKDGIISYDFLINNKELFEVNNYSNIMKKMKLFKDEGINYRLFINDLDVYLIDNNKLLKNINILKQYTLLFGLNKLNLFELLKDDNLEIKIDMLLELGYEKKLEENLDILNFDILKIKKLYILKNLRMLPVDYNDLVNIFNNKTILDSIDDVDSYLFNISSYKVDSNVTFSGKVDYSKFYSSERVIEIGGVILSVNRIKRNISMLDGSLVSDNDKLVYAIIKDSILSEEEYNLILNNLSDVKSKIYC